MRREWAWALGAVCAGLVGCRDGSERLGNAGTAFDVTPSAIDFGPIALGERSLVSVRVANRGAAPVEVTQISTTLPLLELPDAAAFRLESGEGRDLQVIFAPQAEGGVSGVLQLRTDSEELRAQVPVQGRGVSALAEVRTQAVDFGSVELGTVKMGEVQVANPRAVPAQVAIALGGADADEFASSTRSLDLAPGEVRSVALAFRPTRLGVAQGVASVSTCLGCPKIDVPVGGTGVMSMLDISPTVVDFGRVPIGSSAELHVKVRNQGSQPFDFKGARLLDAPSGVLALTFVPVLPNDQLDPGAVADLAVRFSPVASGAVQGALLQIDVSPAGSGAPGPKLPVLAAAGTPCLRVSPSPLDFGTVPQGMTSTLWLQLWNRCYGSIEVSGQALATTAGGYFTLPAGSAPIFLDGGGTSKLAVSFTPRSGTAASAGTLTLQVHQADGSGGTEQVPLRGANTTLPPCAYQLRPSALDFGSVAVGAAVTLGLSLTNTGTASCFVGGMQVAAGSDPQLTADPLASRLLAPGASATLRVRFQPDHPGAFAGLAEGWVNSSTAGHPTAQLSGIGTDSCFTLAPSTVDFGIAKLGCPSRQLSVTGFNRCTSDVFLPGVALEAPQGSPFSIATGPSSGAVVAAGSSASWVLRYAPGAEGDDSAALRVQALGTTFTAGVVGTAQAHPTQTDHFAQQGLAKVDVLFVIDNSGSMMEEQASLAQNFAAFLSGAQQQPVDYHIGVTTTGIEPSPSGWSRCPGGVDGGEAGRLFPADGSWPRIITRGTSNAAQVFANNVSVGICHWDEQGLQAAYRALSPPLVNNADDPDTALANDGNLGFLRPDALLAVVFVSDEDDGSPGTVDSYETFLRTLKANDPTLLVISAIVGPEDLSTCPSASSSGSRYIALARHTGGVVESICTNDWAASLGNISGGVFSPRRRFPLSQVPADPSQIAVEVNGAAVTSGWTYDAATHSIVFDASAAPSFDATIDVTYPLGC